MDECERLLREIDDSGAIKRPEQRINTEPLFQLRGIWPEAIDRLKDLLTKAGELELVATIDGLQVFDRCRCGADYCATVYTRPQPSGGYGPTHRNIVFSNPDTVDLDSGTTVGEMSAYPTTRYMTILDVVDDQIACIEILDDHESRRRLVAALPNGEGSST